MLTMKSIARVACCLLLPMASVATQAQDLIFSAPPRGAIDAESATYQPIAKYLSQTIGKKIIYKHPGNWLTYQKQMQEGNYDLVFDGPHFVSWRTVHTRHEPLVKLPGLLVFVVITRKDNTHKALENLKGRTVCGFAPPNLATLTLFDQFPNPAQQPVLINVKSFGEAYKGVIGGKCNAAVMRDKMFAKLNKGKDLAQTIFTSAGVANQAFSAGPKIEHADRQKIIDALRSDRGMSTMEKFHARFNKQGKPLQTTSKTDYQNLDKLLKDVWGFGGANVP